MLIHPEIYAWLNSQTKVEPAPAKKRPRVTRPAKINKGGQDKTRAAQPYAPDPEKPGEDVEYLNERPSNLNLYA
ncbi:MAG: hypothetical protein LBP55_04555 [Candidatus Adiutrix sp.]|jgi:hypothetical protein|nr:hypothetical protein [Candidatus Adiutrix sp.]